MLTKDVHAAAVAFICALLAVFHFPLGFVAAIIVGLLTLQKGLKSGLFVLSWVALPPIALLVLHKIGLFDLLFFRCVGIWLLAGLLRRFNAWGLVLEVIAFVGVAVVLSLNHFVPHLQAWWSTELTGYIQHMIAESHWELKVTPAEFAQRLSPIATGVSVFFIETILLLELLVARLWQLSLFRPGNFAEEFTRIRVGYPAIFLVLLLIVLMLLKIEGAKDAFPVTLLPFFVAGLSLVHFWVRRYRNKFLRGALILLYVGLILLPAPIISFLALLAVTDIFCHFRKKNF